MEFKSEDFSKALFFLRDVRNPVFGDAGSIFARTFLSEHEISHYCSSKDHILTSINFYKGYTHLKLDMKETRNVKCRNNTFLHYTCTNHCVYDSVQCPRLTVTREIHREDPNFSASSTIFFTISRLNLED